MRFIKVVWYRIERFKKINNKLNDKFLNHWVNLIIGIKCFALINIIQIHKLQLFRVVNINPDILQVYKKPHTKKAPYCMCAHGSLLHIWNGTNIFGLKLLLIFIYLCDVFKTKYFILLLIETFFSWYFFCPFRNLIDF